MKLRLYSIVIIAICCSSMNGADFQPLIDNWTISDEIRVGGPNNTDAVIDDKYMSGVRRPTVASNGSGYIVVWSGWNDGVQGQAVFGVLLDASGEVLPSSRFMVPTPDIAGWIAPRVASNGESHLVVWLEDQGTRLVAARVSSDGTVLGPGKIEIRHADSSIKLGGSAEETGFVVESSGADYLVAWHERSAQFVNGDYSSWKVYGVRVGWTGEVLDAEQILFAAEVGERLSISRNSYNGFRIINMRHDHLSAIIDVSSDGQSASTHRDFYPRSGFGFIASIGYNGENHLVTWTAESGTDTEYDLFAGIVATGFPEQLMSEFVLSGKPEWQTRASVASDRKDFFVVWNDSRNSIPRRPASTAEGIQLYGSRVSGNGAVLDLEGLPLVTNSVAGGGNLLASNGSSYLLVYGKMGDLAPDGTSGGDGSTADTIKAKLIINTDKIPLELSSPTLGQDGAASFQFNAAPGASFEVQYSDDLKAWNERETFLNFSGEEIVTDPTIPDTGQRFYRALKLEP